MMDLNNGLFSNIGIDSVGFYTPRYYLDLEELAENRNVPPEKYTVGLLLKEFRVPDFQEDIVSMSLKAGTYALRNGDINPREIDGLFVATETMTYAAKSVSNILSELFDISVNAITQDIYNTCAGGTLALIDAFSLVEKGIINKALIIFSDICSYAMEDSGEPTQGAGSAAFVISRNPRIAVLSNIFGRISRNINDFYRPPASDNAKVFGKFSVKSYISFQLAAYNDLFNKVGDIPIKSYVFHAPFPKLVLKFLTNLIIEKIEKDETFLHISENLEEIDDSFLSKFDTFIEETKNKYQQKISDSQNNKLEATFRNSIFPQLKVPMYFGNQYSASLWSQIIYLLENYVNDNDIIYFGSYGSGATCISGLLKVQPNFKQKFNGNLKINDFIQNKKRIDFSQYEKLKINHINNHTIVLGKVSEYKSKENIYFSLNFCDKGCLISNFKNLDYCPKGHTGNTAYTFPYYAILKSEPIIQENPLDYNFYKKDLVRVDPRAKVGDLLEFELRRINIRHNPKEINGFIDWAPYYVPSLFKSIN
ncbi:MAG: hydroxymethylglutaryl-CoA synthase family protein [Promethearchaeota archaeon]|nr:MAG: hydroxymethylglutaryl-CoA synthase family protein [Candidatus Lokiarchaeota archaeon]